MREKLNCGLSIFFLADKAIMPTEANIPAGYSVSVEPVAFFDYRDKDAFVEALWEAIQNGNPDVPNPPDEDVVRDASGFLGFKRPVELKYAGVESWEDLERSSIYGSVCVYPSGYVVEVFGRAADGTWGEDRLLSVRIPIDAGVDGVVDTILAHLETRTDLPVSRVE
ncbi:MAG: hypothetical protein JST01_19145 [Cyanobacteria bacterium SZAS TMP-1]|nr:hypothetical protein [Cyanobacteria bacterium SZAS TMP-1]